MSVVINKKINELNSPIAAFTENNYVIFSSSSAGAIRARVKIKDTSTNLEKEFNISLDLTKKAYFNASEALKSFFNLPEDNYQYLSDRDELNQAYKIFDFTYTIIKQGDTEEVGNENGVVAIRAKNSFKESKYLNCIYLMPRAKAILFQGYPQSITMIEDGLVKRKRLSNGLSTFNTSEVHETVNKNGLFVKWLNEKGGYTYWLFSSVYVSSDNVDRSETINKNQFEDYFIEKNNFAYTEKSTSDVTFNITAKTSDLDEQIIIQSIIESEEIYIYSGGKDSGEVANKYWIKVRNQINGNSNSNKREFDIKSFRLTAPNIAPDLIPYILNCREKLEAPTNLAAVKVGQQVELDWEHASTEFSYEIEKSFDQISWVKIGETKEKELTTTAN